MSKINFANNVTVNFNPLGRNGKGNTLKNVQALVADSELWEDGSLGNDAEFAEISSDLIDIADDEIVIVV